MELENRKSGAGKTSILANRVSENLSAAGVSSVIAGISGGADSVAMLFALKECGIDTIAVHCNFHLRGAESDRDMRFVKDLCERLDIDLHIIDFDVDNYMKENHVSTEMACRELRYAEFRKLLDATGYDRIAVAHNADDNVETLFLNLMRGAGVAGLRAMVPDTGEILRPLLDSSREEILHYLADKGECFVTDSTNLKSDYRRNFIRNEVIPLLESRWPEARKSVTRTIRNMQQEEQMLRWAESLLGGNSTFLTYEDIKRCPDSLWIISRFISRFGGNTTQAGEIDRSINQIDFQSGKQWSVDGGRIISERDRIEFVALQPDNSYGISANVKKEVLSPEIRDMITKSPLTELWTTLPSERLAFRRTATGDRIKPLGMKGSVLVSKIMKDAKLSQSDKERAIVAEDKRTGEIIWVYGLKRSRLFLIDGMSESAYHYTLNP